MQLVCHAALLCSEDAVLKRQISQVASKDQDDSERKWAGSKRSNYFRFAFPLALRLHSFLKWIFCFPAKFLSFF